VVVPPSPYREVEGVNAWLPLGVEEKRPQIQVGHEGEVVAVLLYQLVVALVDQKIECGAGAQQQDGITVGADL
jgi:hypothetical protein